MYPGIRKEAADQIAKPLYILFKNYLETGNVPIDWLAANICAINKKALRKLATNYRPVSLTSFVSKLLESIIRDHLMEH